MTARDEVSEIARLASQGKLDQASIAELRAQAAVDDRLIVELRAAGIADRKQIENLKAALLTARRIGTALGILMTTQKITSDAAFDLLSAASQHTQRKLRDVADEVVLTGALPC